MLSNFPPKEDRWNNGKTSRETATRHADASNRRRNVDPTTCDKVYKADEIEFMNAMQEYKKSSGQMLPTWSEVQEVARAMGYEKPLTS
jgi:hypothetical protein